MGKIKKGILNVPHLRFDEFKEEWRNTNLGNSTTDINYGLNLPSKKFDGKTVYIRITDIDKHSGDLIDSGFTSPDGELNANLKVAKNDILIARTGASTGKSFIFDHYDFNAYFAGYLIRFRPKEDFSPHFLYYNLNTSSYDKFVNIMSARSGQPGINSEEYKSYSFSHPSLLEQEKISSFLKKIDERIILQMKLIENYESLIKWIYRFELTDQTNKQIKLNYFLEETNERVGNENIEPVAVGVLGIRKRSDIYEKELSNDYSNNKIIRKNSLSFGIGTHKIVYDVLLEDEVFCVSPAYKTFNVINIDPLILKLILDLNNTNLSHKHMIISARQGKSVDFKGLLNEKMFIPSVIKQNKILKNIKLFKDNLVLLKNEHLELTQLKKYLLDNLFI